MTQNVAIQELDLNEIDAVSGAVSSDAVYGFAAALVVGGAVTGNPELIVGGVIVAGGAYLMSTIGN